MKNEQRVELIYDADCPNQDGARGLIERTLRGAGLEARWREHCRQDVDAPPYARNFGSPTILVNGRDVAPTPGMTGNSCRIYRDGAGRMSGLPPAESILAALQPGRRLAGPALFASALAGLPGMLPVLSCAACWPAYTAVLSAMGLGFLNYTPVLLPLMLVFSTVALFGLFHRARLRRGLAPFALGVGATVLIFAGYVLTSRILLYAGSGLFLIAAVWNAWPVRDRPKAVACDC